jgi:hypothetical protein
LRRTGVRAASAAATAASIASFGAVTAAWLSLVVLSGCERLLPSR